MAKKRTTKKKVAEKTTDELTAEAVEEQKAEDDIQFEVESVEEGVVDLSDVVKNDSAEEVEDGYYSGPSMASPEWPAYVMSKFTDSEVDENGSPFVHGLRRVSRLLLGPTITSMANVIKADNSDAVVQYQLVIEQHRESDGLRRHTEYAEVGDVNADNTKNKDILACAPRVAATQAEARCYRKALMLHRVIAAEERGDSGYDEKVSQGVLDVIDFLCCEERLNLDAEKVVNMGSGTYRKLTDIPLIKAYKIVEYLGDIQRGERKAPEKIAGYKSGWMEGFGSA